MRRRWVELYQGQDEWQFFVGNNGRGGLVRSSLPWRSVEDLTKESGLSAVTVRSIVDKYKALGMIVSSPKGVGYWERVTASPAPA
jgi:hypothetical protein